MMHGKTALMVCLMAAITVGVTAKSGAEDEEQVQRPGFGPPETTHVTLTLLDVEVTDRSGRPIQGLTRNDFTARIDGRRWPIYSVDDLCDCTQAPADTVSGGAPPDTPPAAVLVGSPGASAQPVRFILYFDYSQLQQGGRITAMKEAKRWIQTTMRPDDEVMLAAFSTAANLRTLAEFTRDRGKLLKAIDKAFNDPAFMDPFPTQLDNRIDECSRSGGSCGINAMEEYYHGRRSLEALKKFLAALDQVPGHKSLIFFHENGNIEPGDFYGVKTSDQAQRLEEIGAEATSSHVAVFPATAGDANLLGFALADYTGGQFNRTQAGLSRLIDEARTRCSCIYRIALVPPDERSRRIYPVTIAVNGRVLSGSYRIRALTEMDRWLRSAQAVLVHPERAQDLFVTAGLIPVGANKGRWEIKVQVALNLGSLTMLPAAGGHSGMWEIGAALVRDDGKDSWEMLGLSEVHQAGDAGGETWVVHERSFYGLPKGKYHLAAFVRDRAANVFGGSETTLELPKPGSDGVAGPILLRPGLRQLVSTLPLMRGKATEPAQDSRIITGSLPAGSQPVEFPATLEAMTWICPRGEMTEPASPSRFISRQGVPFLKFDKASLEPAGECLRITDRIDRWNPQSGFHAYHLIWKSKDGAEVARVEAPFEVSASSSLTRRALPQPNSP